MAAVDEELALAEIVAERRRISEWWDYVFTASQKGVALTDTDAGPEELKQDTIVLQDKVLRAIAAGRVDPVAAAEAALGRGRSDVNGGSHSGGRKERQSPCALSPRRGRDATCGFRDTGADASVRGAMGSARQLCFAACVRDRGSRTSKPQAGGLNDLHRLGARACAGTGRGGFLLGSRSAPQLQHLAAQIGGERDRPSEGSVTVSGGAWLAPPLRLTCPSSRAARYPAKVRN